MVTVKEATAKAIEFAEAVLPGLLREAVALEEVDTSTKGPQSVWLITLSMPLQDKSALRHLGLTNDITTVLGYGPRQYKTFAVSRKTGEVLSMKIRELATAE